MSGKQPKPYVFKIKDPMYGCTFHIYVGKSDEVKPIVSKAHSIPVECLGLIGPSWGGCSMSICDGHVLLWIAEDGGKFTYTNLSALLSLIHESFHAIGTTLRYIGTSHTEETEETYAYMQTWLLKTIFERMEKRK